MSEPSDAQSGKDATPSRPASASKHSFDHLPEVDSPSISPAGQKSDEPVKDEAKAEAAAGSGSRDEDKESAAVGTLIVLPRVDRPRMKIKMTMSRRARRNAMRAATIVIAAGLGAIAGVLSMHVLPSAPKQEVASIQQQTIEKSIVMLAREVDALKSNVDKVAKSTQTQVGKIAARIDAVKHDAARHDDNIVTGSIKTQVVAPAAASSAIAAATAATITAPLPQPRPPIAQVVSGWSAYVAPDGAVLVEQHGGDMFQVTTGVPLPGLGRVEAIRRENGRVEVVTAKGIVVSPPQRTVRSRYQRLPSFFERY
jgi:hypothetical protein